MNAPDTVGQVVQEACRECGMPCAPSEYHPYAACPMFRGCSHSATVRANLNAVIQYALITEAAPQGGDDLLEANAALVDEIREIVGLKGKPGSVIAAVRALAAAPTLPDDNAEAPCSTHPDAPHGFDRNASYSANRYVCNCEGWVPPATINLGAIDSELIGEPPPAAALVHEPVAWRLRVGGSDMWSLCVSEWQDWP